MLCLAAVLTAATVILSGCDGTSTSPIDGDEQMYRLTGLMVKDYNLHAFRAMIDLTRNDSDRTTADVVLRSDTLPDESGVYSLEVSPAGAYQAGDYNLSISDSSLLDATISAHLPDSFGIDIVDPANRINNGGAQVSIDWFGSDSADGYVVAAVPDYKAYTGPGYAAWASTGVTAGTIPPEAFRWTDGVSLDTGWYYIYVYSFSGAPDSALSRTVTPTPLPGQLADNINMDELSGRFGAVLVARRDSVHVVYQP